MPGGSLNAQVLTGRKSTVEDFSDPDREPEINEMDVVKSILNNFMPSECIPLVENELNNANNSTTLGMDRAPQMDEIHKSLDQESSAVLSNVEDASVKKQDLCDDATLLVTECKESSNFTVDWTQDELDDEEENFQGPHNWRKKLKPINCDLGDGKIKRDADMCPDKSPRIRNVVRVPSGGKKDHQMAARNRFQQAPNPMISVKRNNSKHLASGDGESPFTKQVVKDMKSAGISSGFPRNRLTYQACGRKTASSQQLEGTCVSNHATMIEKARNARLYLLQQTGPNQFQIGGDSPDHKYKVTVGSQKCSCGRESCVHVLFVMLRVFQVPHTDPILSQKTLKNYEVETLFRNFHARRSLKIKKRCAPMPKIKLEPKAKEEEKPAQTSNDVGEEPANNVDQADDGNDKEEEELCPICLLEMVEGESLTECKNGCQNRLHHHCIAIWFEECRRQNEPLVCPLCRAKWKLNETSDLARQNGIHDASISDSYASPAEPIPPEHREMADKWIPILGEELVSGLLSKNWTVRETALRSLGQEAVRVLLLSVGEGRMGVQVSSARQENTREMLECCCWVLTFTVSDPVYKVFVGSLRALRLILSYTPCRDEQQLQRLQSLIKPIVKSLLLKCSDSNRRTSQLSISALQELVRGQQGELAVGKELVDPGSFSLGGVDYLLNCIIEDYEGESVQWQWVLGRFCMLEKLVEEYHKDFTVGAGDQSGDASENRNHVFTLLPFCVRHMNFGHIKVSKLVRKLFFYVAKLQLPQKTLFEEICSMLNDVEPMIQVHMERKLRQAMIDFKMAEMKQSGFDSGIGESSQQALVSLAFSTPTDSIPNTPSCDLSAPLNLQSTGSEQLDKVIEVSAEESMADEIKSLEPCSLVVSPNSQNLRLSHSVEDCVVNESESNASSISRNIDIHHEGEKRTYTIERQTKVEVADVGVCTSPVTADVPSLPPSNTGAKQKGLPDASYLNSSEIFDQQASTSKAMPAGSAILAKSLTYPDLKRGGQKEGSYNISHDGFTDDLSDLYYSSSEPEEKISFKTEIGSPHHSPNNTADENCHCKEEVEKEEAEALAEALQRSEHAQDALPYVPGLSRAKSCTSVTIYLQDEMETTMSLSIHGIPDKSHQYQEGVHWKRGPTIGSGAACTCYQARDVKTGTLMAVKQISFCRNTTAEQDKVAETVREEIQMMAKLNHPNIVRILGATQQGCHFFMFVEWMPGCSVAYLLDKYGQFSDHVITSYTLQILQGLTYLHENNILHRDLKGANMLVDGTGRRVRIGDFGASARLASSRTLNGEFQGQLLGTVAFMAPEVLRGENYGRSCDMWSLGCCIIEMSTAKPPWGASDISNHLALIYKIASTVDPPPIPENILPAIRDLTLRCLEINPKDRPFAKDLLKHPLFRL